MSALHDDIHHVAIVFARQFANVTFCVQQYVLVVLLLLLLPWTTHCLKAKVQPELSEWKLQLELPTRSGTVNTNAGKLLEQLWHTGNGQPEDEDPIASKNASKKQIQKRHRTDPNRAQQIQNARPAPHDR